MRLPWQKKTEQATAQPLMIAAPSDSQGMDVPRIEVGCTYPVMFGSAPGSATVNRIVQHRLQVEIFFTVIITDSRGIVVTMVSIDSLKDFIDRIIHRVAYDHCNVLSVVVPTNLLKGL